MEIQSVSDNSIIRERTGEKKQPGQDEVPNGEIQKERVYSKAEISKEIEHLNKWLEPKRSHLQFVLHDKLNEYYVQLISDETNEVIREIPSKKLMDIMANFYEKLGFIMDKKV